MAKKSAGSTGGTQVAKKDDVLLKSLRAHGQVVESDNPDAPLGPGQTHVNVKKPGQPDQLIERRKSFFSR